MSNGSVTDYEVIASNGYVDGVDELLDSLGTIYTELKSGTITRSSLISTTYIAPASMMQPCQLTTVLLLVLTPCISTTFSNVGKVVPICSERWGV